MKISSRKVFVRESKRIAAVLKCGDFDSTVRERGKSVAHREQRTCPAGLSQLRSSQLRRGKTPVFEISSFVAPSCRRVALFSGCPASRQKAAKATDAKSRPFKVAQVSPDTAPIAQTASIMTRKARCIFHKTNGVTWPSGGRARKTRCQKRHVCVRAASAQLGAPVDEALHMGG